MKNRTIWMLVLVVLFVILLIQNAGMTPLRFYFWSIYAPQFILVFFIFLIGFLVGFLGGKSGQRKERRAGKPSPPPPLPAEMKPPVEIKPPQKPQP